MKVETHLYVGLDEDGNPVAAFRSLQAARNAVESDCYRFCHVADYCPDVPAFARGEL